MEREFALSHGQLSFIISAAIIVEAVTGPFMGHAVDRYGAQKVMAACVTTGGAGFILLSTAQSPIAFACYLAIPVAIGCYAGFALCPTNAVAYWFVRKRGLALAIAASGFALGGVVVRLDQFLIDQYGWRTAAVVLGCILFGAGYPLAMLFRGRPERYGYLPDGEARRSGTPGEERQFQREVEGFTVRDAVRTQAFWRITLTFALRDFAVAALGFHFIPMMVTKGITEQTAAGLLTIFGLMAVTGRLIVGYLGDHYSKNLLVGISGGFLIAALVMFAVWSELWQMRVAAALYGFAWGGSGGGMIQAIRAEYFGRRHLGKITGAMQLAVAGLTLMGTIFAGQVHDATGTYTIALYTFVGAVVLATFAIIGAQRPALPPEAVTTKSL